jgi:cytochrome bd-type quinol oxidase subunit 2
MNSGVFPDDGRQHVKPDVLLRTRRSVMEAAHLMGAKRARQRRHAGIALLVMVGLLVLFAPALWSAASDLTTGEHFFDLPVMVLTLSLVFLAAMLGVVLMNVKNGKRGVDNG